MIELQKELGSLVALVRRRLGAFFLLFAVGTIIIKPIRKKKEVVSSSFIRKRVLFDMRWSPIAVSSFFGARTKFDGQEKYTSSGSLTLLVINKFNSRVYLWPDSQMVLSCSIRFPHSLVR